MRRLLLVLGGLTALGAVVVVAFLAAYGRDTDTLRRVTGPREDRVATDLTDFDVRPGRLEVPRGGAGRARRGQPRP